MPEQHCAATARRLTPQQRRVSIESTSAQPRRDKPHVARATTPVLDTATVSHAHAAVPRARPPSQRATQHSRAAHGQCRVAERTWFPCFPVSTYYRHRATPLSHFDEEGFRDELTTNFFNVQKI